MVNSHTVSVYVGDGTKIMKPLDDQPTILTFFHLKENGVHPTCISAHFDTSKLSVKECRRISTSKEMIKCACTSSWSFALVKISAQFESSFLVYFAIGKIGSTLSVVCLAFSLFALTFFRSLHNVRNTVHCNLCFSLLVDYLVNLIREWYDDLIKLLRIRVTTFAETLYFHQFNVLGLFIVQQFS
ncbi:unnamed protein product [Cylicocyclus nassatus]|uniref:Uncharacterized protein n=1 Tax=Cylicocyclus nassatus TaxID=53992 RepID=A0AA36HDH4_CYLNA|nr:unnamed protein product [Cylicocyclus nassatus]